MNHKKILLLVSLIAVMVLTACSGNSSQPGKADALAQCLTDKGVVMYGTEWCPHCKAQKDMFGSSFQYVTYVDCDKYRQACVDAGVQGFPTWVIDGANYAGTQPLYILAQNSGCSLEPQNSTAGTAA